MSHFIPHVKSELWRLSASYFGSIEVELFEYSRLLNSIYMYGGDNTTEALKIFIESILREVIGLVISRRMLSDICLLVLKNLPDEMSKELALFVIEKARTKMISFEDEVVMFRQYLALIYERENNLNEAISMLYGIPFESGHRNYSDDFKMETYLKLIDLFLKNNNLVSANAYFVKASKLQIDKNNKPLQTSFELFYAKLMDRLRNYINAAKGYYIVSKCTSINEDDRLLYLKDAAVATILSSRGPSRSQLLNELNQDERCKNLSFWPILEKIILQRIIRQNEVTALNSMLHWYQKRTIAEGLTILDQIIIEHNLLAVSKLYKNIRIEQLALILNVTPIIAEKNAALMIRNGCLEGSIDQVESLINFRTNSNCNMSLLTFDQKIQSICLQADSLIEKIRTDFTPTYTTL